MMRISCYILCFNRVASTLIYYYLECSYFIVFTYIFYLFQVRVSVLDKNDSPPSFRDTQLEFSVSEDLPGGSVVGSLKATDPDTIGQLRYQLLSGGDGHFIIEANSGVLRLNDSLDREDQDFFRLVVRAHDGIQYADATVKVRVS